MKPKKLVLILLAAVLVIAVCSFTLFRPKAKTASAAKYKTTVVAKGNLEETISSTGTTKATGTVEVLAQLTGNLEQVFVDFNDQVKKNQPLAKINTDKLQLTLKEEQAAMEKTQAQFEYDEGEYKKSQKLFDGKLISESDLAAKKLAYLSSKAALAQAETTYQEAKLNIDNYAVVLSPITGIVLDRAVDPGQTVVGSGNTNTTLFTLAESLTTMQVYASVDELDIARVKLGQEVRFTVEAYSDKKFTGKVTQIRKVPTTSDNVVSYTVIVEASNPQGFLLPGMTATLDFLVSQKKDVVLVPSAAFKFTPPAEVQAAARRAAFMDRIKDMPDDQKQEAIKQFDEMQKQRAASGGAAGAQGATGGAALLGGGMRGGFGGPPGGGPGGPGAPGAPGQAAAGARPAGQGDRKPLWLLAPDGSMSVMYVTAGASDGTSTEVVGGDALIGKTVIVKAQ